MLVDLVLTLAIGGIFAVIGGAVGAMASNGDLFLSLMGVILGFIIGLGVNLLGWLLIKDAHRYF